MAKDIRYTSDKSKAPLDNTVVTNIRNLIVRFEFVAKVIFQW